MLPSWWLKGVGTFFVISGIGISITFLYIIWWMAGVMLHSGDPGAVNRYTGTRLQAVGIFALMSAVLMFGVTSLAMGVWWIMRTARNPWIIRIGIFVYMFVALGFAVLQFWMD
jgi:hypothetical protein